MGKHFVGLDASARSVNICIVDVSGHVVHERKMGVDPEAIATHILSLALDIERIGLEAGMLSQYLYASRGDATSPHQTALRCPAHPARPSERERPAVAAPGQ